jgi:hypothetical protein
MDELFLLGQVLSTGALAWGAWICAAHAGEFDAESLRRELLAARIARRRNPEQLRPSKRPDASRQRPVLTDRASPILRPR